MVLGKHSQGMEAVVARRQLSGKPCARQMGHEEMPISFRPNSVLLRKTKSTGECVISCKSDFPDIELTIGGIDNSISSTASWPTERTASS